MNIADLKELLDDYGDHVPVVVELPAGNDYTYHEVNVGSGNIEGHVHVILTPGEKKK